MVAVDGFAVFAQMVVLIATFLALLLSSSYLKREHLEGPEYFALMLCSATGMMLMTSANDLITVFLSLEILSIALYVLAAFDRRRTTSQEAGLKYFLLGSFSSAVFLYGVGAGLRRDRHDEPHRHRRLSRHHHAPPRRRAAARYRVPARGSRLQGRGGAVPHVDARRVPGLAHAGHRVHGVGHQGRGVRRDPARASSARSALYSVDWRPIVFVLAVLSLFVGSIAAIVQTDVKRMLAYSSISHAGYVLIAVQAATARGTSAALFYVLTYTFMTIGAFACVAVMAGRATTSTRSADYRGLARRQPFSRACSRCSCSRRPACRSPVASWRSSRCSAPRSPSASTCSRCIGMLAAAVAAFVYLRIILAMYSPAEDEEQPPATTRARVDFGTRVALDASRRRRCCSSASCPGGMLDFAKHATQLLSR